MNDDFLRHAWRRPSAEFTSQLRERLQQQELAQSPRRRPRWRLLTVLLLVGGAAVAMYLTARNAPFLAFFSTEANQPSTPTAIRSPASVSSGGDYHFQRLSPSGNPNSSTTIPQPSIATREHLAGSDDNDGSVTNSATSSTIATNNSGSWTGIGSSTVAAVRVVASSDIAKLTEDAPWRASYERSAKFEIASADTALRRLCTQGATNAADVVITTRRITADELASCKQRPGDIGVLETRLAYMATVITRAKAGSPMPISPDTLWRALLKQVPSPQDPYRLIDNPYTSWHQIDRSAEDLRIEVIGPPRDSREFSIFAATVLDPACKRWIQTLQGVERGDYEKVCRTLRQDGVYVEATWDDTFVRQRLWGNPNLVAITDYRFYSANRDDLVGSLLDGAPPTRESLVNGSYAGARGIYFYVNGERDKRVLAVDLFVREFLRRQDLLAAGRLVPPDGDLNSKWWSLPPLKLTEAIPE